MKTKTRTARVQATWTRIPDKKSLFCASVPDLYVVQLVLDDRFIVREDSTHDKDESKALYRRYKDMIDQLG